MTRISRCEIRSESQLYASRNDPFLQLASHSPLPKIALNANLVKYKVLGILTAVESAFELQKFNYGSPDYTEKIVQIVIGAVLVISAFVGCCGAVNASVKVLILYLVILLALAVAHVWVLWRFDEVRLRTTADVMVTYTWIEELVERGRMNFLQERYECCGKRGYNDYTTLGLDVPESCYFMENNKKSFYPHADGCLSAVSNAYLRMYRYEKWLHGSLLGLEICGIILCIVLLCNLAADSLRYTY